MADDAAQKRGGSAEFDPDAFTDDVRAALYASKVVAYAQGFDQLAAGSEEHGWDLDLGTVATIWRGGCIIRASFLDRIREVYADEPDLTTLLTAEYFSDAVSRGVDAWRRVVTEAVQSGIPSPAFSSSLAYFDGLLSERLPAALIQVLRDNFGAHTYRRVDREGTFHTNWAGDRAARRPSSSPYFPQPRLAKVQQVADARRPLPAAAGKSAAGGGRRHRFAAAAGKSAGC